MSAIVSRVRRISLFRWRFEWALALMAAVSGALSEQAREARERDPYQLVKLGRIAQGTLTGAREIVVPLGTRRGVPQQEIHVLVDLEWQDREGSTRQATGFRLDAMTAGALRSNEPGQRWPRQVSLLYLDPPQGAPNNPRLDPTLIAQDVLARRLIDECLPLENCRLIVLPEDALSPAEEAAQRVDYVLERAPHAFTLSIALLLTMLILRLVGVIENRPSLE